MTGILEEDRRAGQRACLSISICVGSRGDDRSLVDPFSNPEFGVVGRERQWKAHDRGFYEHTLMMVWWSHEGGLRGRWHIADPLPFLMVRSVILFLRPVRFRGAIHGVIETIVDFKPGGHTSDVDSGS